VFGEGRGVGGSGWGCGGSFGGDSVFGKKGCILVDKCDKISLARQSSEMMRH